jgi:hypothetical protein
VEISQSSSNGGMSNNPAPVRCLRFASVTSRATFSENCGGGTYGKRDFSRCSSPELDAVDEDEEDKDDEDDDVDDTDAERERLLLLAIVVVVDGGGIGGRLEESITEEQWMAGSESSRQRHAPI